MAKVGISLLAVAGIKNNTYSVVSVKVHKVGNSLVGCIHHGLNITCPVVHRSRKVKNKNRIGRDRGITYDLFVGCNCRKRNKKVAFANAHVFISGVAGVNSVNLLFGTECLCAGENRFIRPNSARIKGICLSVVSGKEKPLPGVNGACIGNSCSRCNIAGCFCRVRNAHRKISEYHHHAKNNRNYFFDDLHFHPPFILLSKKVKSLFAKNLFPHILSKKYPVLQKTVYHNLSFKYISIFTKFYIYFL